MPASPLPPTSAGKTRPTRPRCVPSRTHARTRLARSRAATAPASDAFSHLAALSQVGQRQPAKRSTLERKTKEASTQNAQYTKWLALGRVAGLSGGCQSSWLELARPPARPSLLPSTSGADVDDCPPVIARQSSSSSRTSSSARRLEAARSLARRSSRPSRASPACQRTRMLRSPAADDFPPLRPWCALPSLAAAVSHLS